MSPVAFLAPLITILVSAVAGAWFSMRPRRIKNASGRMRLPKFVPLIGWFLVVVGALMSLVAFGDPPEDDALAMQIASIAIALGGLAFLFWYRNFYVAAGPDEVAFRTFFRTEKTIRYADIVSYSMRSQNGMPMLDIKDAHGTRLSLNPNMYALGPLLAAIDFREHMGRWPLPGEPR